MYQRKKEKLYSSEGSDDRVVEIDKVQGHVYLPTGTMLV